MEWSWGWDAIIALSSALGVVGGLLSLAFLIVEVRHTARATEGGTVQSLMDLEATVFRLLAENSTLYLKGSSDPSSLSEEEAFRYDKFISAQMSLYYSAYVQYQAGLIPEEMWQAYVATLHDYLKKPGFQLAWKATEAMYPEPFRRLTSIARGAEV